MTIEIHTPELEQRVERGIRNGQFRDVDELLTRALDALEKEQPAPAIPEPRRTREEAVAHMLEARKGRRLPDGVTIRDLINKGRA
jgi:hypothetical protein